MANDVSVEQVPSNEPVENKPVVETETAKKPLSGFIISIINFILILVLAGGFYYLLQEMKHKQLAQGDELTKGDMREIELSKQFSTFQAQLATLQSQIATVNEEMTGKDIHYNNNLANFSKLHTEKLDRIRNDLTDEITQLKRQLGKTRGDWLIADAEYLLSVANQRLHLMADVKTTLMALEAADQRLRESGDTAAFKVREQIAKEISGLSTVTLPDIVGMYASVQTLKDKVGKLAVLLPYAGKPLTESKQVHDHDQTQDSEHGILNSALQLLEGYVTVKHSDHPVTKILTEEEAGFIKEQLNVKLEMIKIALVQQSDALYKSSITDAKQWLNQNFAKNEHSKSFMTKLEKLNDIQLRSQLPDISKSLKMLRDITKLRIEADKAQMDQLSPDSYKDKMEKQLVADPIPVAEPINDTEQIEVVDKPAIDEAISAP